jgi:hypothetical protein
MVEVVKFFGGERMNEQSFSMAERRESGSSWVNILLGLLVIISPFVFG